MVGPGHQVLPRISSDGQWVLFQEPARGTRVRRSCVCHSPVAGRNRCSPPPRLPGRDVLSAAGVSCSSGTGPVDHFITRPSARQRGAARFDTVQHQGRGPFPRRKRRGTRCRRRSFDESHSDLFVAWRAAEGGGGGERRQLWQSRLGRHRSRLFLHRTERQAAVNCCSFDWTAHPVCCGRNKEIR